MLKHASVLGLAVAGMMWAAPAGAAFINTADFSFNANGSITVDANAIALWQVASADSLMTGITPIGIMGMPITLIENTPAKVAELYIGSTNPITGIGAALTSDDFSLGVIKVTVTDEAVDPWDYRVRYQLSGVNPVDAYYVVPEPATLGVLAMGGLVALFRRRK